MLYTGEKVGTKKGPSMDLAIDPLECTSSVAYGRYNDGEMSDYIPTDAELQAGFDGIPKI